MNATAQRYEFQTEVTQLLDLMIHSLYSNKDIFLRELISNSSDALDRLRFEQVTNEALQNQEELHIRLQADKGERTISIIDNGIGMSREDVIKNLGTIARSGTKEFTKKLKEAKQDSTATPELIGQFGVGFYSSFMVAAEVTVVTKRAGEDTATLWRSTGDGGYELEDTTRDSWGTTITLKLKPADEEEGIKDYTVDYTLKDIVKKYSDFVSYPIKMEVTRTERGEDDSTNIVTEDQTLNSQKAIWARAKGEVTEEEHKQFYQHISHDWADPLSHIELKIEGTFEAQGLLYIPTQAPFDLYHPEMKRGIQLYVRRVFIMDECKELAPAWLRFVKGVVDASDLDLNVSREILQQSRQIRAIRKQVVKKVLDELNRILDESRDEYLKFWNQFGPALKEGFLQGDDKDQERLLKLLICNSSKEDQTTLNEYIARMPEDQDSIYYLTAPTIAAAKTSPHVEAFEAKGYEVLFFADNIDELWLERVREFDGKKLISVGHGEVDLDTEEDTEKKEKREAQERDLSGLLTKIRSHLQEDIKEVRVSSRLTNSPVCLVGDKGDMSPQMEKLMAQLGRDVPKVKRIMEVNAGHAVIGQLKTMYEADENDARIADYAQLLFGQAILAEGSQLPNPAEFGELVGRLMVQGPNISA